MQERDLITKDWKDYELIDSGEERKLERYGKVVVSRPETQALWATKKSHEWNKAQADFRWAEGRGSWKKKDLPDSWELQWKDIKFEVRLTSFKHTGIFPEQAANWDWLMDTVDGKHAPQVLNLFGYTGIASVVAAKAGAIVTHVDASKTSNAWAKKNAELSGVPAENIRFILDDAMKFAEREVRRGASYDGIILDPPAFGRGAKGEVWKIEELPKLLETLEKLFSKKPGSFFLLNGYAAGYSPASFAQAVESVFGDCEGSFGELQIRESQSDRVIPSGIYVRFIR